MIRCDTSKIGERAEVLILIRLISQLSRSAKLHQKNMMSDIVMFLLIGPLFPNLRIFKALIFSKSTKYGRSRLRNYNCGIFKSEVTFKNPVCLSFLDRQTKKYLTHMFFFIEIIVFSNFPLSTMNNVQWLQY